MSIEVKIKKVREADSSQNLVKAVSELASQGDQAAIPTLIEVLGYNNPGAAVAAVNGLVKLGRVSVEPILNQIDGYNYGARAWAVRALAEIGDGRALELLLDSAANDFSASVRRSATKGLGNLTWEDFSAQQLCDTKQLIIDSLLKASQEPEWVVRYAAISSLEAIASIDQPKIIQYLQTRKSIETDMTVRARIQMALEKLL
jgi:phycocyanobilin lyase beta subunit